FSGSCGLDLVVSPSRQPWLFLDSSIDSFSHEKFRLLATIVLAVPRKFLPRGGALFLDAQTCFARTTLGRDHRQTGGRVGGSANVRAWWECNRRCVRDARGGLHHV